MIRLRVKRTRTLRVLIRLVKRTDRPSVLQCLAILQDAERRLKPRLRPGRRMAAAYYAQLRRRSAKWRGAMFVAEQNGAVVGLVVVFTAVPYTEYDEPPGTFALVADLVVVPRARRQGVGKRLLAHAERYARTRGATDLLIGVLSSNRPAVRLYLSTGVRPRTQVLGKLLRKH